MRATLVALCVAGLGLADNPYQDDPSVGTAYAPVRVKPLLRAFKSNLCRAPARARARRAVDNAWRHVHQPHGLPRMDHDCNVQWHLPDGL